MEGLAATMAGCWEVVVVVVVDANEEAVEAEEARLGLVEAGVEVGERWESVRVRVGGRRAVVECRGLGFESRRARVGSDTVVVLASARHGRAVPEDDLEDEETTRKLQRAGALRSMLVHGPRGVGKRRSLVSAAESSHTELLWLTPEDVFARPHAPDATLAVLFQAARRLARSGVRAVVVVDEMDTLLPRRPFDVGESDVSALTTFAPLLLQLTREFDEGDVPVWGVAVDAVDVHPCIRSRFDWEVPVPPLSQTQLSTKWRDAFPAFPPETIDALTSMSGGFTLADVRAVRRDVVSEASGASDKVEEAALVRVRRHRAGALANVESFSSVLPSRNPRSKPGDEGWDAVGGHDEAKQALVEAIVWPRTRRAEMDALGIKPPRGVVMHGPPGTGKTLLARTVATQAQCSFLSVSISDLVRGEVGATERVLAKLFSTARACAPCVLFFDEAQAVFAKRGSSGEVGGKLVAQLAHELDGLRESDGVVLLAATNVLSSFDSALLREGRFERLVHVGPCRDAAERLRVFQACLLTSARAANPHLPDLDLAAFQASLAPTATDEMLSVCRAMPPSTTGADIAGVVSHAILNASVKHEPLALRHFVT